MSKEAITTGSKIKCNCCGKELDLFDLQQDFTIHRKVEYGSVYDGTLIEIRLCCDCFDKLVMGCAVSPIVNKEVEI